MSAISSQDIISILKEEIENYDFEAKDREIGHVIWVGDGIATVYGILRPAKSWRVCISSGR